MNKKTVCVFDLDGTFYPKESPITFRIRESVINLIAVRNNILYEDAKKIYGELPKRFVNPYEGLVSVGVKPKEYKCVFDSISKEIDFEKDLLLLRLLEDLSNYADIYVVSLSSEVYAKRMLMSLGIDKVVNKVLCVNEYSEYSKYLILKKIAKDKAYVNKFSIGDDDNIDLLPARELGYEIYKVDFSKEQMTIYSIIKNMVSSLHTIVPRIMRVENTTYCNERCTICPYEKMNRQKGTMEMDLYRKIIDEHSAIVKTPKLIFPASVGEPFLDEYMMDRVKYASRCYSEIAVFSNASVLDEKRTMSYIESGGTELMLTLHGYTKKNHEMITKSVFYETVRKNIDAIVKLNNRLGNPIKIYLDVYADEEVVCDDYIEEKRGQGVIAQKIPLKLTHNWGGKISEYSYKEKKTECKRIYEQFGVQYNGTVVPCCIDVEADLILGNAKESRLEEIFTGRNYMELIDAEKSGRIGKYAICSKCNI